MNVLAYRSVVKAALIGSAAILLLAFQAPGRAGEKPKKTDADKAKPHRTDWLHQAKWGVMFHYCSNWFKMGKDWDKTIENFDVKGLAKQLDSVGAGYLLITAKHCGQPIAPNAAPQDRQDTTARVPTVEATSDRGRGDGSGTGKDK